MECHSLSCFFVLIPYLKVGKTTKLMAKCFYFLHYSLFIKIRNTFFRRTIQMYSLDALGVPRVCFPMDRVLFLTFLTWACSLCAPSSTWPPRPALGERCTVSVTTRRAQVGRAAYRQLISEKQGSELGRGPHLSSIPAAGLGVQDDAKRPFPLSVPDVRQPVWIMNKGFASVLKIWYLDQQPQHHLGTC